jgi:hypothetical protein
MNTKIKTENKTYPKAIPTTEITKVHNKPVITNQHEIKKPKVDVKKPDVPEAAPITNDKERFCRKYS